MTLRHVTNDANFSTCSGKGTCGCSSNAAQHFGVAGSAASIYTFEPAIAESTPADTTAHQGSNSPLHRQRSTPSVQKLWLIYRPGHYEIVYPEEGCEDLEKL